MTEEPEKPDGRKVSAQRRTRDRGPKGWQQKAAVRREKVLALKLQGLSYPEIAAKMGVGASTAKRDVARIMNDIWERMEPDAKRLAALELERLDKAQAAIWDNVLKGDYAAIDRFTRLSHRRGVIIGWEQHGGITIVNNQTNIALVGANLRREIMERTQRLLGLERADQQRALDVPKAVGDSIEDTLDAEYETVPSSEAGQLSAGDNIPVGHSTPELAELAGRGTASLPDRTGLSYPEQGISPNLASELGYPTPPTP